MKRQVSLVSILLLAFCSITFAQITVSDEIKVNDGISKGTISATTSPQLNIGSLDKIFDGNAYTEGGVSNRDTLKITLSFTNEFTISKSKLFCWNDGKWSLEVADNISDLDGKTGSYKLLVNNRGYSFFNYDSSNFQQTKGKVIRLTAINQTTTGVIIGDWVLVSSKKLTKIVITPFPPRLLPNTTLQAKAVILDEYGNIHQFNEPFLWSSSDTNIVAVDGSGNLKGKALGSSTITASTETGLLTGNAVATVETDFRPPKANQKRVKVALVIQDQFLPQFGKRIHQKWNWSDPINLVNQLIQEFFVASDSVVKFEIVELYNDQFCFTKLDTSFLTIEQLTYYFTNSTTLYGEMKDLAERQNRLKFDYNYMVDYYDFDTKRNNGTIDEVWVYTFPFGGMWESQLMGPGAFWWNSPPLPHNGLNKCLSVMGLNYERGVPEAMESFGHRTESALVRAFGRWDNNAPNPNHWEIFTQYNKIKPGNAHVGNIHFPPNGTSDYNWNNSTVVTSYADNWFRYPYLLDQTRQFNCTEWSCSHLGYMRWWYKHLPHAAGITDTILNNWWHYMLDFYEAVELAKNTSITSVKNENINEIPNQYKLEQNFPNPFNSSTKIRFSLKASANVSLKIYDILGREVQTLVDEFKSPGSYEVNFNSGRLSSGVYFYQIIMNDFVDSKKFVVMK